MSDLFTPLQTQKTTLSGSGCTSTATSIILSTFVLPDGSTAITMANFGNIGFGTLEPGTSREEQISFTGITANGDGTYTLTGVTRGLRFVSPYDEVSANKKAHAGGAIFVISNTAGFYDKIAIKSNDETVSGLYTFSQNPVTTAGNPTLATELARKGYVDSVVAGIASTVNLIVPGVAGETLAAGNLIYLKAADGRWWLCDADTAATVENVNLGLAQGAGTAGNVITSGVLTQGLDSNQSALTASTKYYAGNTAGAISTSAGTKEVTIGFSHPTDATKLYFQPRFDQHLTEDEQDALAGTEGTPNASNTFATKTTTDKKISQTGAEIYAADSVGTDSYAITLSPVPSAYVNGLMVNFKAGTANTGAATLNVNSLGAKAITKLHDQALETGDIEANQIVTVVYNSTIDSFQMVGQTAQVPTNFTLNLSVKDIAYLSSSSIVDTGNGFLAVELPDAATTGRAGFTFTVPQGATSISSMKMLYIRGSTGNVYGKFFTEHIPTNSFPSTPQNDSSNTDTAYAGGAADSSVGAITVPAGAYDTLSSIIAGSILNVTFYRNGSDALDTYNTVFHVVGLQVVFA